MPVDQRNSGTQRNRKLARMRKVVEAERNRFLFKATITRHSADITLLGSFAIVIDRLAEIRNSQTLKAPERWEDLRPHPREEAQTIWNRGVAELGAELDRMKQEAAVREARNQKMNDSLRELGL
jgi:hypothetical protein